MLRLGLMEMVVLAAAVGVLVLAVNKGGRTMAALLLGGIGLLFAGGMALTMYYVAVRSSADQRQAREHYSIHESDVAPSSSTERLPTPAPDGAVITAVHTDSAGPSTVTMPAWVKEPTGLLPNDVYRVRVVSNPKLTRLECDEELGPELQQVTYQYIDSYIGDADAHQRVRFSLPEIRRRMVVATWEEPYQSETESIAPMIRLHALLEFDKELQDDILSRHRESLVRSRLTYTGTFAGMGLTVLAAFFGYLKLDTLTRGYYTGRLRAATGAVLLAVAAAAVFVFRGGMGY